MNNQEIKLKRGIEIIHLKYQSFHDFMVQQTPEEIYNASHHITAIQEFYSCMLNCEDDSIDKMICLFAEQSVDFEVLCKCFEENASASISTYENTIEFFRYVLQKRELLNKDRFFIDKTRRTVLWMYYNPDSNAGGAIRLELLVF